MDGLFADSVLLKSSPFPTEFVNFRYVIPDQHFDVFLDINGEPA